MRMRSTGSSISKMPREPFLVPGARIGSISFQNDRNSALAFAPSTFLTSFTPPKKRHSGTGTRSDMYHRSGTPKMATCDSTFVSPANQSCRNDRTPSWMDIDRSALPAESPFSRTVSPSSFR